MKKTTLFKKEVLGFMIEEINLHISELKKVKVEKIKELLGEVETEWSQERVQNYLYFIDGEIEGLTISLEIIEKYN